ncbi:MAG: LPS export ABC transporter ATP-binding protein [Pseudomonadota bacterium]
MISKKTTTTADSNAKVSLKHIPTNMHRPFDQNMQFIGDDDHNTTKNNDQNTAREQTHESQFSIVNQPLGSQDLSKPYLPNQQPQFEYVRSENHANNKPYNHNHTSQISPSDEQAFVDEREQFASLEQRAPTLDAEHANTSPFDLVRQTHRSTQQHHAPKFISHANHNHKPHAFNSLSKFSCLNIAKSYGANKVLQDISIDINSGESVGILGPNGAGKTTSFYILTGLISADEGKVLLNGHDVTDFPMHIRAQLGISYLPQDSSIFHGLNVEDNIRAILQVMDYSKTEQEQKLKHLMDEFNITHLAKNSSLSLSGGERRRLEIARAIATNPNFILLDEPFAGIDPVTLKDIRLMIADLCKRDIGVLITDHNVVETLKIVDRAYVIHAGMVLAQGTPYQIASHDAVRKYYLGDDFDISTMQPQ